MFKTNPSHISEKEKDLMIAHGKTSHEHGKPCKECEELSPPPHTPCNTCKPKPNGFIPVEDVYNPHCIDCGRKLTDTPTKQGTEEIRKQIQGLQLRTLTANWKAGEMVFRLEDLVKLFHSQKTQRKPPPTKQGTEEEKFNPEIAGLAIATSVKVQQLVQQEVESLLSSQKTQLIQELEEEVVKIAGLAFGKSKNFNEFVKAIKLLSHSQRIIGGEE